MHRHHHAHSDDEHDVHSPGMKGFLWAHIGWLTSSRNFPTDYRLVKDLTKYPELVFLNRFDLIGPLILLAGLYGFGAALEAFAPGLGTSGWQMVVWGFFISTVLLYHGTFCINSFTHLIGKRRFPSTDHSRNHWLLALITLGEGWHNNHHANPNDWRFGLKWWQIDVAGYLIRMVKK